MLGDDDVIVLAGKVGVHAGDHLAGELLECAIGTPADMRSQNNARHMADGIIYGEWLVVKYIKRGGNVAFLQAGEQRTGLDDFGARGIDQHCAGLEMSKVFSGDNATSGIIQRQMDGNNITGFNKLIEIVDRNGTRPFKMLGRHM